MSQAIRGIRPILCILTHMLIFAACTNLLLSTNLLTPCVIPPPHRQEVLIRRAAEVRGMTVAYKRIPANYWGRTWPSWDCTIEIQAGLPSPIRRSTLVHEIAHQLDPTYDPGNQHGAEVFAESVSYLVEKELGWKLPFPYFYEYTGTSPEIRRTAMRIIAGITGTSHETWCKF